MFVCIISWSLRLGWQLVLNLNKEDYFQILKSMSFWLHSFCGWWEGWEKKEDIWIAYILLVAQITLTSL